MSEPNLNETGSEPSATPAEPGADANTRQWGMFAHLAALAGFVIPFGNIIGPLVVWQTHKDMPFVVDQGKEALNFQITVAIAALICFVLMFIAIGLLLLPVVGIAALVFTVIAAIKANDGERYRYPISIRMIK
ncbi:MAG: DUF4870 domain-containing protein [Pseudomonadales bacterium]